MVEASQKVGDVLADWLKWTENQNKQRCITATVHPARSGLIVADMPHTSAKIAPIETKARCATKKNAKPVEPWSKKNIWGAGGNEIFAFDLFCRGVCGKFGLCDCFCKDTGRPIKFGGGGRRYRTTAELFHTLRNACYICGTFFSAVARTGLRRR
jgi:hypothetical protein